MKESIDIAADAETVWPLVADPVRHAEWNEKVVSIERDASGTVTLSEQFVMLFRMSGRDNETRVEVIECQPPHRVVFRHRGIWRGQEQISDDGYEIKPIRYGVKLTRIVDLSHAVPWYALALIWFIQRFGSKRGKSSLDRLRELIEPPAGA